MTRTDEFALLRGARPIAALDLRTASLTALRHLACILALMWTGLVNGQPFFFQSDTTNYIRAADAAVYVVSGGMISTSWTERHRQDIDSRRGVEPLAPPPTENTKPPKGSNDIGQGLIMSGRSPYIGALMYLGYVLGNFWPFVLLQAAIAYALILLTMKRFGVYGAREATGLVVGLAATTALPSYNSMLLADAFTGFGVLAFLLLASPGRLARREAWFLVAVILMSAVSHLTHIMILIGMVLALAVLVWWRFAPKLPARAWVAGAGAILVGFASVQATALATKMAFGSEPQLLPLLTARFIADGPGKAYIDSGCEGQRFEFCKVPIGNPHSEGLILFGRTPQDGAYMLADVEQRRLMGEQDKQFAIAVLRFDPVGQAGSLVRNTFRQLVYIDYDGLNQDCFSKPECWESLPPKVRNKLRNTPSGQGLWPQATMNALLYIVVLASLAGIAVLSRPISRRSPEWWQLFRTWLIVGMTAMLVCSFFGGAVAEPQYRYMGRMIWLVPFAAGIALLMFRKLRLDDQPVGPGIEEPKPQGL